MAFCQGLRFLRVKIIISHNTIIINRLFLDYIISRCLVKVAELCLTFCNFMDRILQVRILEWVALPSSRVSSQSRDQTQVSSIAG